MKGARRTWTPSSTSYCSSAITKPLPFDKPKVTFAKTGNLLASPLQSQYASAVTWSANCSGTARHVDDICFIHGAHGTNLAHGGALLKSDNAHNFVRLSMGAVGYGLGTKTKICRPT